MTSTPFVGSCFADADFQKVCQLLLGRRGFDLSMYKDQCVKRRIASRVRACGFQDAAAYLELLERDEDELDALLAAISIHVSQFFRNPGVFALLEKQVLPELIDRAMRRADRRLDIWSVGCAGGEEPYSIALLLHELKPPELQVSILGSDISQPILRQAREACFEELRLHNIPESARRDYFLREGRRFRLVEPIRTMVDFFENNILELERYPAADLILCRNVLIYFSREDQNRVLQRFAELLPDWGRLVLGNAENILGDARQLFRPCFPAERIYQPR